MLFAPRAASLSNKVAQLSLELKGSEEYTTVRITRILCVLAPVCSTTGRRQYAFPKGSFLEKRKDPSIFHFAVCARKAELNGEKANEAVGGRSWTVVPS